MRACGVVVLGSVLLTSGAPPPSVQGALREAVTRVRLLQDTRGEEQRAKQAPFTAVQGAFFALSVDDLNASTRWYVDTFDLEVSSRLSYGNMKGALLAGHGLEVELIAHPASITPPDPLDPSKKVLTRGIFKVGFRVEDFESTIAALKARGVEFVGGPFPPRRDQRANAMVRDNAGNLIQLFGDFAR